MKQTDLEIGQIVKSKSGRDAGRIFVVFDKIDDNHVLIVDGSLRRLDKPKKKKIKHLARLNLVATEIREAILNDRRINNAFIRKELAKVSVKS